MTKVTVTLADEASVPDAPARPKPKLYAALAMVLGLALGLALAALRERLDRSLRSVEDLEQLVDAPILARVPRRGRGEHASAAFTEAFRVLRTNLQFAHPDGVLRTIAVTSWAPVEGKSTTVSQLARVSAAGGGDVLVVEADLKRPSQQGFFRPDATRPLTPGLTTFIVGGAALADCIHPTGISSVQLLPAGPQVPSLSGLLESARGREVLDDLATAADLVLFDCPPLSVGADAATVAGRVDGVVLVVNIEDATGESVREALRGLQAVRARVLGIVVNRDPDVDERAYGYGEVTASRSTPGRVNL